MLQKVPEFWGCLICRPRNIPQKSHQLSQPELPAIGHEPKGSYSPSGRSRHLLETRFSEPLLRTLLTTLLFTVKPIAGPLLRTLLRTLPQNPSQNLLGTLLRTLCCRTSRPKQPSAHRSERRKERFFVVRTSLTRRRRRP